MKRSLRVQLVLITAALASCSREWVPRQSIDVNPSDPALTAAPLYGTAPYYTGCEPCSEQSTARLWNYSFNPFGTYYWPGATWYYPGGVYRKGSVWRNDHVIVRGGLGKSANSAGA
jgi:hypothetical protein